MSLKDRLNLYLLIINVGGVSYTTPIFTADKRQPPRQRNLINYSAIVFDKIDVDSLSL